MAADEGYGFIGYGPKSSLFKSVLGPGTIFRSKTFSAKRGVGSTALRGREKFRSSDSPAWRMPYMNIRKTLAEDLFAIGFQEGRAFFVAQPESFRGSLWACVELLPKEAIPKPGVRLFVFSSVRHDGTGRVGFIAPSLFAQDRDDWGLGSEGEGQNNSGRSGVKWRLALSRGRIRRSFIQRAKLGHSGPNFCGGGKQEAAMGRTDPLSPVRNMVFRKNGRHLIGRGLP